MRIGIHKLGFENFGYDPEHIIFSPNDKNGMLTEVNLLMAALETNGHKVEYVHTTESSYLLFDQIFVFNGMERGTSTLQNLKSMCNELNYLVTDSRVCHPTNSQYIDHYFVQSEGTKKGSYDKPVFNSKLYKLPLYESNFYNHFSKKKNKRMIFGGSIRERKADIFRYIYRPNVDFFLKDEEKMTDDRLPIEEYKNKLKEYSYGIVLINHKDIEIGNITWRYFEYIANGVFAFVDRKADPAHQLLDKNSFMYVSSYEELKDKIELIERHPSIFSMVKREQREKIHQDDLTGKTFAKSLIESRELNDSW